MKPETVVVWHRKGFRLYWSWKSRPRQGRPSISTEVRKLIRRMSAANPSWGAPRIHGKLGKFGIVVSQTTVAKYMVRHRRSPSQTWRNFLSNHCTDLVFADFCVVPTAHIPLAICVRPVRFDVTSHPTAESGQRNSSCRLQPGTRAPRFLLRDGDGNYGNRFRDTAAGLGIEEVLCAPRSPWQNAHAERLIGSIRP